MAKLGFMGLGIMGFQDALYQLRTPYASQEAVEFADRSMEAICYHAYWASTELAAERGRYSSYRGSLWDRGILPLDSLKLLAEERGGYVEADTSSTLDWDALRARIAKAYDIMPKQEMMAAEGGYGAVLNYSAYGAANTNLGSVNPNFSGASALLDARAYAPFGVLRQTGTVGTTTFDDATAIRLDTTWTTSNQERAETYRAGDFISGSLNWTRPVRMGGLEAQRNFALRPDLITTPMASMAGSAAVPSTLDVFINIQSCFHFQYTKSKLCISCSLFQCLLYIFYANGYRCGKSTYFFTIEICN